MKMEVYMKLGCDIGSKCVAFDSLNEHLEKCQKVPLFLVCCDNKLDYEHLQRLKIGFKSDTFATSVR